MLFFISSARNFCFRDLNAFLRLNQLPYFGNAFPDPFLTLFFCDVPNVFDAESVIRSDRITAQETGQLKAEDPNLTIQSVRLFNC